MRSLFFICTVFLSLMACNTTNHGLVIQQLEPKVFKSYIEKDKDPIILDVRTPEEVMGGKIAHAMNVNWNDPSFKNQVNNLDKNKNIYVYCLSGGRSASAGKYLSESGFRKVYELKGGILNWNSENLPLVKELNNEPPSTTTSQKMEALINLTESKYNELINSDKLVLVDFNATWCGPCKMMAPFIDKIADENKSALTVLKIDVDKNADLASALKVRGLPTLMLYKGNKRVWNQLGYISEQELTRKIDEFL